MFFYSSNSMQETTSYQRLEKIITHGYCLYGSWCISKSLPKFTTSGRPPPPPARPPAPPPRPPRPPQRPARPRLCAACYVLCYACGPPVVISGVYSVPAERTVENTPHPTEPFSLESAFSRVTVFRRGVPNARRIPQSLLQSACSRSIVFRKGGSAFSRVTVFRKVV